ncbi:DUF4062 domain-containing protein [Flavobacterium sp. LB2P6]|uniref:DUF4062 domain-containing protein n=1 Tax=Flavobacterium sp. LB2P6 TaxID=3401714 RepID=UPI003AADE9AA
MNNVNIFVSSTCYDLSQVRADLSDLIISLGHMPIMSDSANFPINPSKKTIDNCIDTVTNFADILVLIVGNRYGSIIENGKSITSTEFLTAKNKNIPIFIFIDKKTMQALNFWKSNPEGDFTYIVDNIQIFEFIENIRSNEQLWVFEFDKAQDISSTLKNQFSNLFKETLKLNRQFKAQEIDSYQLNLSNLTMNILLKKEMGFEYEFFAQVLVDEIFKKENFKNDYTYSIHLENKHHIGDNKALLDWFSYKLKSFGELVNSLSNLINKVAPIYIAEPGVSSDIKGLYYIGVTYARAFERIINWTTDVHSAIVPDNCENLKNALAKFSKNLIEEVWQFPFNFLEQIQQIQVDYKLGDREKRTLMLSLKITVDENASNEFYKELELFKETF